LKLVSGQSYRFELSARGAAGGYGLIRVVDVQELGPVVILDAEMFLISGRLSDKDFEPVDGAVSDPAEVLRAQTRPVPIRSFEDIRKIALRRFLSASDQQPLQVRLDEAAARQAATSIAAEAQRLRNRWPLSQLVADTLFADWRFMDGRARKACRAAVKRAAGSVAKLVLLAEPERVAVLETLVVELNDVDERFECIETEAREGLCGITDALAVHLGLPLRAEGWADKWRDW
jgi:hypothetical protein